MAKVRKGSSALDAAAWEEAALEAIARGGPAAVAVEPLARELGVTKGSFYWHFENRDALLTAALTRWESGSTEAIIQALDGVVDPRERLGRLLDLANRPGRGRRLHAAIASAANDPLVRPHLERVTERRLGYLKECYRRLGSTPQVASHAALLAYSSYLGLMQVERESAGGRLSPEQHAAFVRYLIGVLLPPSRD